MEPGSIEMTLESMLGTIDAATIERDPRATIAPPEDKRQGAMEMAATLPRLAGSEDAFFVIDKTLGEGGMGRVRLATQVALDRKVAIKTLKDEAVDARAVRKMLQEALITGKLEHPNIVPVHDLRFDGDGRPQIVLKRIEGEEWAALMHAPDRIRQQFGADDPLEWNIGILTDVCQALRFAHSRGIVHRDLKPENVMIGEFGEVYILDWGIAVSTVDDGKGRIPLAKDATIMAGTPCYMAPEMLGGERGEISPATDVYLVGACLYEVLMGRPPHDFDSAREIVASVVASPPRLPDSVPEELTRICQRAMAFDQDGRFENVEQVRLALRGFLQHRGSRRLAARADTRRIAFDEALEANDEALIHQLFAECRFGYRAALEAWRDNDEARSALRELTLTMVRYDLQRGDPLTAYKLLQEISDPPSDLVAEAERRRAVELESRESLERFQREANLKIGVRARAILIVIMGVLWIGSPLSYILLRIEPSLQYIQRGTAGLTALWVILFLLVRKAMLQTRMNRGFVTAIFVTMLSYIGVILLAGPLDLDVVKARTFFLLMVSVGTAFVGGILELRLLPISAMYLAGATAAAYFPDWLNHITVGSHTALLFYLLWINREWGRGEEATR